MNDNASKGFLVYYDSKIIVDRLSDSEAGKLFKALFAYATEGIDADFEAAPVLAMAFDVMRTAIDRNAEWYKKRCEKNRENGRKGGLAKASNRKKMQAEATECKAMLSKSSLKKENKDKTKRKQEEREEYIDYQQIADLYNETCVSFPRLTKLSESRKKAIRARLKQYSVDDFRQMFELAESSDFLKGKNDRNWSATFDWMVKDANMAKILDGNYSDKKEGCDNGEQISEAGGSSSYQNLVLLGYRGSEESVRYSDKFSDGPFG